MKHLPIYRKTRIALILLLGLFYFVTVFAVRPRKKSNEKIVLKHADRWSYDQFRQPDAQFLNGNVILLHSGMTMSCDSAILFQATNSFEAFGHVKILQGDTLSLKGEYLFYDGGAQLAQMRKNVIMKHRTQTLLTDSLNYDRLYGIGYFFAGGELIDAKNRLTSDWGEYDTKKRKAKFNYS